MFECVSNWSDAVRLTHFRNVPLGGAYISYSILALLLYTPCLIAMLNRPLIKHASYKLMAVIGILDCMTIVLCSLMSGIWSMIGIAYCCQQLRILHKVFGAVGASEQVIEKISSLQISFSALWSTYSGVNIVLALNRAFVLSSADAAEK